MQPASERQRCTGLWLVVACGVFVLFFDGVMVGTAGEKSGGEKAGKGAVWLCKAKDCGGWTWWNKQKCHDCGAVKPPGAKKVPKPSDEDAPSAEDEPSTTARAKKRAGSKARKSAEKELKDLKAENAELKKQLEEQGQDEDAPPAAGVQEGVSIEALKAAITASEALKGLGAEHERYLTGLREQLKRAEKAQQEKAAAERPFWVLDRRFKDKLDKIGKKEVKGKERLSEIESEITALQAEAADLKKTMEELAAEKAALTLERSNLTKAHLGKELGTVEAALARLPPSIRSAPELTRADDVVKGIYDVAAQSAKARTERALKFGSAPFPREEAATGAEAQAVSRVKEVERQLGSLAAEFGQRFQSLHKIQDEALAALTLLQVHRDGTGVAVAGNAQDNGGAPVSAGAAAAGVLGTGAVPSLSSSRSSSVAATVVVGDARGSGDAAPNGRSPERTMTLDLDGMMDDGAAGAAPAPACG